MRGTAMIVCLGAAGCAGPLTQPLVWRLDLERQAKVNEVWEDMFATPDRLDRTLLLDVLLVSRLFQRGVDHLHMVSEKQVGDGLVVMVVQFDREVPENDSFTVTYLDPDGMEVRQECFTRDEVVDRMEFLFTPIELIAARDSDGQPIDGHGIDGDSLDTTSPDRCAKLERRYEEWEQRREERKARMAEIKAIVAPLKAIPDPEHGSPRP